MYTTDMDINKVKQSVINPNLAYAVRAKHKIMSEHGYQYDGIAKLMGNIKCHVA